MGYFTERQELIELPSSVDEEEREKIDSFLGLLEDSGVGPIILSAVKSGTVKGGAPPASWKAPEGMEPQRFKKPSPKKLSKKGARVWAKMDAYRKAKGK